MPPVKRRTYKLREKYKTKMPNTTEDLEAMLRGLQLETGPSTSQAAQAGLNNTQISQIKEIIRTALNLDSAEVVEEEDSNISFDNPEQFSKIPDVVKCLREFSGNPGEFNSWRKSVDRILEMYQNIRTTGKYYAILHVIRQKIVGHADTALESYRTPLDWKKIKTCLMMHYSDKRDISTLQYQLTTLTQQKDTIEAFYQRVYQHLSLILDKIDCLDLTEESLRAMTNAYRDKALDTFIRGLNGDLPRLLSIREPTSLPQALNLCNKLDNMTYRLNHAQLNRNVGHHQDRPLLPPKPRFQQQMQNQSQQRQNMQFHPELVNWPNRNANNNNNRFNNFGQQRPFHNNGNYNNKNTNFNNGNYNNFRGAPRFTPQVPPKPLQMPEPMDVDRSLNSVQVNYQNRPQPNGNNYGQRGQRNEFTRFPTKRPSFNQESTPNKLQRNFYINNNNNYESGTPEDQEPDNPNKCEDNINFLG